MGWWVRVRVRVRQTTSSSSTAARSSSAVNDTIIQCEGGESKVVTATHHRAAASATHTWGSLIQCRTWGSGSRTWGSDCGRRSFHCVSLLPYREGGGAGGLLITNSQSAWIKTAAGAREDAHGRQPLPVHGDGLAGGVKLHSGRRLCGVLHHTDVTWESRKRHHFWFKGGHMTVLPATL